MKKIIHTPDKLLIQNPDGVPYSALYRGDCKNLLARLPDNSVSCIIQDEPYGLNAKKIDFKKLTDSVFKLEDYLRGGKGLDGEKWDADVPPLSHRLELIRVLKHGGFALVFTGHRNIDVVMNGLRAAGFEIADVIGWVHCQGVPKGKKLDDKFNENSRKYLGARTSVAPAMELIIVARKPKKEKTLLENQIVHGVGLLNIAQAMIVNNGVSRFPKNVIFEKSKAMKKWAQTKYDKFQLISLTDLDQEIADELETAQALLFSKAPKKEKEWGLENEAIETHPTNETGMLSQSSKRKNKHKTVKPIDLMRYLIRLVSFEGDTVLDCFTGSGTTGIAALLENRKFIGAELGDVFFDIAAKRIKNIYLEKENEIKKVAERELVRVFREKISKCQTAEGKEFLNDELSFKICELYFNSLETKEAA